MHYAFSNNLVSKFISHMKNKLSIFARKLLIGLLPRNYILKRKLNERIVFRGINKQGFGGRGVFIKGLDYEAELSTLPFFLSDDSVFIDIGANSGIYSIMA